MLYINSSNYTAVHDHEAPSATRGFPYVHALKSDRKLLDADLEHSLVVFIIFRPAAFIADISSGLGVPLDSPSTSAHRTVARRSLACCSVCVIVFRCMLMTGAS